MKCPICKRDELISHPTNPRVVGCPNCLSTFRASILDDPQERETKPIIPVVPMKKVIKFMDGEQQPETGSKAWFDNVKEVEI